MKFRKLYLIPVISIVFIVLNPTINQFKEFNAQPEKFYLNETDQFTEHNPFSIVRRRTQNFLLFSFFELGMADSYGNYTPKNRYIGICFNFFEIRISKANVEIKHDTITVDTAALNEDAAIDTAVAVESY